MGTPKVIFFDPDSVLHFGPIYLFYLNLPQYIIFFESL